jgi:hypothetical protein
MIPKLLNDQRNHLYITEKGEKDMKKLVSLPILCFLLFSIVPLLSAYALPANSIWITPSALNFSTNTTSVGHEFNVTVWLNVTTPTNAWQFFLVYKSAELQALDCEYTGVGKSLWAGKKPTVPVTADIEPLNASYSYVVFSEVLSSGATLTGAGSLAWVEFNITYAPPPGLSVSTGLLLDQTKPFKTRALGAGSTVIPLTLGNSIYTFSSPWTPPPPASIYVDPSKVVDPLLTPCHNFTVNVTISKATDVYSFAFKLGFDKNIVKAWNAQLGSFFPPSAVSTVIVDNASGFVQVSAHLTALPTISGNGTLATIKFHVENLGPSALHLYDVSIQDDLGRTLPSNTADGYFNNVLLGELYVNPPEIIDPTLLPPKTFDVNITLNYVQNLYGYEFNMSFNRNVLTCLYLIVQDVKGETNYLPESQVSNAKGFAWARVAYFPPAVPLTTYSPVNLVTIHFRVRSPGISVLHLQDTSLINSTGNPIPHSVTDGFVETLIHDVAVTGATPSTSWAYAGWPVKIAVITKNLGNATENYSVTAYANSTLIGTLPVIGLAPNNQTTLNFTWNTTGFSAGGYVISANATILPYEFNVINNRFIDGTVNVLTAKHDVAITRVKADVPWTYQGWLVHINVTAANLGNFPETFNVTAFYNSTAIGTVHLPSLPAGASITLTFAWNTAGLASRHNYTISADATLVPFEYNITNNVLVDGKVNVRLFGDINGDGIVDVSDISAVTGAFGSYPGRPNWNPACDLDQNNVIDVSDVAAVCANFGKFLPP